MSLVRGLVTYLVARGQERSTWLGIIAMASAVGIALNPDQISAIVTLGMGISGVIAALTADKPPGGPTTGIVGLLTTLTLIGALGACSTEQYQAMCKIDAVVQPIAVDLAPFVPGGTEIANIDQQYLHSVVVSACSSVGGVPLPLQAQPMTPMGSK